MQWTGIQDIDVIAAQKEYAKTIDYGQLQLLTQLLGTSLSPCMLPENQQDNSPITHAYNQVNLAFP